MHLSPSQHPQRLYKHQAPNAESGQDAQDYSKTNVLQRRSPCFQTDPAAGFFDLAWICYAAITESKNEAKIQASQKAKTNQTIQQYSCTSDLRRGDAWVNGFLGAGGVNGDFWFLEDELTALESDCWRRGESVISGSNTTQFAGHAT